MSEKSGKALPPIKGDVLKLDFGQNVFRPGERADDLGVGKRKLPPVPGRAPVEQTVPADEVLNRRDQKSENSDR